MSDDRSLTAAEAALAAAAAELDEVQAVLGRLDDATFDRCQVCGAPIGAERMKADPLTTRCAQHRAQGGAQQGAQQGSHPEGRPLGEV